MPMAMAQWAGRIRVRTARKLGALLALAALQRARSALHTITVDASDPLTVVDLTVRTLDQARDVCARALPATIVFRRTRCRRRAPLKTDVKTGISGGRRPRAGGSLGRRECQRLASYRREVLERTATAAVRAARRAAAVLALDVALGWRHALPPRLDRGHAAHSGDVGAPVSGFHGRGVKCTLGSCRVQVSPFLLVVVVDGAASARLCSGNVQTFR